MNKSNPLKGLPTHTTPIPIVSHSPYLYAMQAIYKEGDKLSYHDIVYTFIDGQFIPETPPHPQYKHHHLCTQPTEELNTRAKLWIHGIEYKSD